MFTKQTILAIGIGVVTFLQACNNETTEKDQEKATALHEEEVTYTLDTTDMKGYIVYNENDTGKRPGILVVHEWWGQTDYARSRARQLAELGYVAMAVDMYGDGRTAEDPQGAQALATPFYTNPQLAKDRLVAAEKELKKVNATDTTQIAAIGYCYGGYVVLNAAKLGADLKGVVSFHGNLTGAPADQSKTNAAFLVLHGADDQFVNQEEVDQFKKQMDSAGIAYTFKSYPGATHAFTNPEATEKGKKYNLPIAYNAEADKNSWEDMKQFFNRIFK